MSALGLVQVAGSANAGPAEVELNTLAQRQVVRPADYTYLGSFMCGQKAQMANASGSGGVATALANYIVSFRNNGDRLCLIRKVTIAPINNTGNYPAQSQVSYFDMFKVENFVRQLGNFSFTTSGTILANPLGVNAATICTPTRLRGSVSSSAADIVAAALPVASTSTSGTFTALGDPVAAANTNADIIVPFPGQPFGIVDAQPVGDVLFTLGSQNPQAIGAQPYTLFDSRDGEYPLVLSGQTGFVIKITTSGSASFSANLATILDIAFTIYWDEVDARGYGQ